MLRAVLHHVSLEVAPDDVDRTIEFFGMVGFERIPAPASIAPFVTWLEAPIARPSMTERVRASRTARRPGSLEAGTTQIHLIHTPEPTTPILGHPAVVPPDFDSAVRGLRGAGFTVEEADELWGERRSFAVMPGGQRVELMAAPPAPVR
jgi:catechol 2,3-dioxygenase-like lactoylglutathione lyase family enzyme